MTISGRMDISRFQQWVVMTFKLISILDTFSEPAQTGPWWKIPFQRSLKAPHPVASVIFDLWHTWRKTASFSRFEIVDELEPISGPYEESYGPGCGGQSKAIISLTRTQKISFIRALFVVEPERSFCHRSAPGLFLVDFSAFSCIKSV